MATEATIKNAAGVTEGDGLSVLDVVKHAVKTVISSLHPSDKLSIVSFESSAHVTLNPTAMEPWGQQEAYTALGKMKEGGMTNLWDGLHTGLNLIKADAESGLNTAVLLLTDGEPNIIPPRGHIPVLKKWKDENHKSPVSIYTFGFGYGLDSELLNEVSVEGDGTYSFIPDSALVGTIFVNTISNLLTNAATNVVVDIEPLSNTKIVGEQSPGGYPTANTSWGRQLRIGSLRYGQSKDIIIPITVPPTLGESDPFLRATVKYNDPIGRKLNTIVVEGKELDDTNNISKHKLRLQVVDTINRIMDLANQKQYPAAVDMVKMLAQLLEGLKSNFPDDDGYINGLIADVKGQIAEAVSREEYYERWGKHYLPSLAGAHLHQYCNNFKDPGVQKYGGITFNKIRDGIDEIFCKIPPPTPNPNRYGHSYPNAVTFTSMSKYYNANDPCFDGSSIVTMSDGSKKLVKDIRKGDSVRTGQGSAQVVCVLKTYSKDSKTWLVELPNGLRVTPWHPIKTDSSTWKFPAEIKSPELVDCEAVYSFVLDQNHIMIINDYECVSLGHGFTEPVVAHEYFGTKAVIEDLARLPGWSNGLIELDGGCMLREKEGGLIVGINSKHIRVNVK
eukprot:TRINITY_DN2707_c0_g1_i1.p1 TRINITY_DN2707_c0_g1~~TRINITY_DN2707_c0_g1_i1.p1  ORF type:complete len:698 (-),score=116.16 TRINITY_DN2707_c0_g1_i1:47-1894(-)